MPPERRPGAIPTQGDSMADVGNTRARYRRILRFAARYMAQAWWYELFLPRIGLASLAARGRARRPSWRPRRKRW